MNLERVVKRRTLRDRYAANSRLIHALRFEVGYILVNIILLAALGIYLVVSSPGIDPVSFVTHILAPYWIILAPFPLALALTLIFYQLLKVAQTKDWPWLSASISLVVALVATIVVASAVAMICAFAWLAMKEKLDLSPLSQLRGEAMNVLNLEQIGFHALITVLCVDIFALFLICYVQMIRGWVSFASSFRKIPGQSIYVYDTTVDTYNPKDREQLQFVASMLHSTGNYSSEEELKKAALDPEALIRIALRSDTIVGATIHMPKSRKLIAVKSIRSGAELNYDILLEDSYYLQFEHTTTPEGKVAYDQVLERSASNNGWIATRSDQELILLWSVTNGS